MDPFSAVRQAWPVIAGAPVLAIGLILIGFAFAWWLKGNNAKSEIDGLKAQLLAREERRIAA
jgi:xanthine/uracil permease